MNNQLDPIQNPPFVIYSSSTKFFDLATRITLQITVAVALLFSHVCYGENAEKVEKKEPRAEKEIALLSAQSFVGGLGNGAIYGAEAELNLTKGLALGAAYVPRSHSSFTVNTISDILLSEDYGSAEVKVEREAKMAFVRLYPFNGSFHFTLTGIEGETNMRATLRDNLSGDEVVYYSQRSQRTAGISFGNNFRFRSFMFGFEWLGHFREISGSKNLEEPDTANNYNLEAAHATVDPWMKATSLSGLSFFWIRMGMGI